MFYLFSFLFIFGHLFCIEQNLIHFPCETPNCHRVEFLPRPIISAPTYEHLMQCAEDPITFSSLYEVGIKELCYGKILFINGILNELDDAMQHAVLLSEYANDTKIYGVHNQTHSSVSDLSECYVCSHGMPSVPSFMLLKQMNEFHKTRPPGEKMLIVNTSGGAIQLKNALRMASKEVRNRIISLSIAPAAIITDALCFQAYSYASGFDPVVVWAISNDPENGHTIEILEPHPDASDPDHSISSPTFEDPLRDRFKHYLKNYGDKR